jgi:hypothetical protein
VSRLRALGRVLLRAAADLGAFFFTLPPAEGEEEGPDRRSWHQIETMLREARSRWK